MHVRPVSGRPGWSPVPAVLGGLGVVAGVYVRGWHALHARNPDRFPRRQLVAFLAGLASIGVAIASPLDVAADRSLSAHMVQHLVLLVVAPPLLLLGAPLVPIARGLPRWVARGIVRPVLGSRVVHWLGRPVVGWVAMSVAMWGWHVPAAFELALRWQAWHAIEHGCFLGAGLVFWWPVVQPWPARARMARWAVVPYLLLADLQNTGLAALLTFSDRVLYPSYAVAGAARALEDQVTAGLVMWVPMSLAYLVPVVIVTAELLSRPTFRLESRAHVGQGASVDVLR
jgi:putative membrane protein